MRKLETYVNEKLKVTKGSGVPNLLLLLECTNIEDFNLQNVLISFYIGNIPVINLEADIRANHNPSQLKKIYREGFITNPNLQNGKLYKEYIKVMEKDKEVI